MNTNVSALSRLPEELLDMILSTILTLPHSSFTTWSDEYTYAGTPPSPAADVLRVCKRWLRVGQPHLYEGIILRRTRQAEALAATLFPLGKKGPMNAALAGRIRRLRIDKVQCKALETVLSAATRVESLHLSLDVPAAARPIKWLSGFRCMSPRRLYLQESPRTYRNNELLINDVEDALGAKPDGAPAPWDNVEEVHLNGMDFSIMPNLAQALRLLPRLRLITASNVLCHLWWEKFIPLVAENEELQAIFLQCPYQIGVHACELDGRAKEITHHEPFDLATVRVPEAPRPDTTFPPLDCLPDSVLRDIIGYAMLGFAPDDHTTMAEVAFHEQWPPQLPGRESLLLVSKKFNTIAEPLFYSAPGFRTDRMVLDFNEALRQRPHLAQHVRMLVAPFNPHLGVARNGLIPVPWILPNLRVCKGFLLCEPNPADGSLVLQQVPRTLRYLHLCCTGHDRQRVYADGCFLDGQYGLGEGFFDGLPDLTALDVCGCITGPAWVAPYAQGLPSLKEVTLRLGGCRSFSSAIILALSSMHLPSLEKLTLWSFNMTEETVHATRQFLSNHGPKLKELSSIGFANTEVFGHTLLTFCPNLERLNIGDQFLLPTTRYHLLTSAVPHQRLKVISLACAEGRTGGRPSAKAQAAWMHFMQHIDLSSLVVLEEIQLAANIEWPESEASAEKNLALRLAAVLKKRYPNVSLADEAQRKWLRG